MSLSYIVYNLLILTFLGTTVGFDIDPVGCPPEIQAQLDAKVQASISKLNAAAESLEQGKAPATKPGGELLYIRSFTI